MLVCSLDIIAIARMLNPRQASQFVIARHGLFMFGDVADCTDRNTPHALEPAALLIGIVEIKRIGNFLLVDLAPDFAGREERLRNIRDDQTMGVVPVVERRSVDRTAREPHALLARRPDDRCILSDDLHLACVTILRITRCIELSIGACVWGHRGEISLELCTIVNITVKQDGIAIGQARQQQLIAAVSPWRTPSQERALNRSIGECFLSPNPSAAEKRCANGSASGSPDHAYLRPIMTRSHLDTRIPPGLRELRQAGAKIHEENCEPSPVPSPANPLSAITFIMVPQSMSTGDVQASLPDPCALSSTPLVSSSIAASPHTHTTFGLGADEATRTFTIPR